MMTFSTQIYKNKIIYSYPYKIRNKWMIGISSPIVINITNANKSAPYV